MSGDDTTGLISEGGVVELRLPGGARRFLWGSSRSSAALRFPAVELCGISMRNVGAMTIVQTIQRCKRRLCKTFDKDDLLIPDLLISRLHVTRDLRPSASVDRTQSSSLQTRELVVLSRVNLGVHKDLLMLQASIR